MSVRLANDEGLLARIPRWARRQWSCHAGDCAGQYFGPLREDDMRLL